MIHERVLATLCSALIIFIVWVIGVFFDQTFSKIIQRQGDIGGEKGILEEFDRVMEKYRIIGWKRIILRGKLEISLRRYRKSKLENNTEKIMEFIVNKAENKEITSFEEISKTIFGEWEWEKYMKGISWSLGKIGDACHQNNLPIITSIVCEKNTRRPNAGFFTGNEWHLSISLKSEQTAIEEYFNQVFNNANKYNDIKLKNK